MAQIKVKHFKVLGLPTEPEPNSYYLVENDDHYMIYVTDEEGVPKWNSTVGEEKSVVLEISDDQHDLELGGITTLNNSTGILKVITGISAGAANIVKRLVNGGTSAILLAGEDEGSAAANRFAAGFLLNIGAIATIIYNPDIEKWEVFS